VNYNVAIRKAAEEDLERIQDWYESRAHGLGTEFRDEIDIAILRIAKEPLSHLPMHQDIRRALVRRFPYKLWFRVRSSAVVVIACTHAVRGPGYLVSRLRQEPI